MDGGRGSLDSLPFTNRLIIEIMNIKQTFSICFALFLLASCTSYRNVPYLQNPEVVNNFIEDLPLYDARIMPKDLLTITINTTDPLVAAPFILVVQSSLDASVTSTTQPALQQYLVDNNGEINFPVLGRLKVCNMTIREVESFIQTKLKPYIVNEVPIVTVRMVNYKISVLGEVNNPGTFTFSNEKVNILEALAMAGDMTIYGVRDDVKLIRENANGERRIIKLNLTNAAIVTSPYYYLEQNDIIYIKPNKTKAKNSGVGTTTSLWLTSTSILVSIASLLATIFLNN